MISPPFELLKLPKSVLPAGNSVPISVANNNLFVGIHESSIDKLSIRPPQVLSAHAVAPGVYITAICCHKDTILGYTTLERQKQYIKVVENENSRPKLAKEVDVDVEAVYTNTLGDKLFLVDKQTSNFHVSNSSDLEIVFRGREDPQPLLYSTKTGLDEVLLVSKTKNSKALIFTQYKLSDTGITEIYKNQVSCPGLASVKQPLISYFDSKVYMTLGSELSVYQLQTSERIASFELLNAPDQLSGLQALPNNNVLISRGNKVELIDCTYQSLVANYDLGGNNELKLLCYSESASSVITMCGSEQLLGLPVEPTRGTLLESLNKLSARKIVQQPITDIFCGFTRPVKELKSTAQAQLSKAQEEQELVLENLSSYINEKNGFEFAKIVPYLKNPELEWQSWIQSKDAQPLDNDETIYEVTDRNADRKLVYEICKMVFLPRPKPYIPLGVAKYLLTHPLFPTNNNEFASILKVLEASDTNLYTQAIKFLPGLKPESLVLALTSTHATPFLLASDRLLNDFSQAKILNAVKDTFESLRSYSQLSVLVKRLCKHHTSLALLGPFVDAIGLLNWKIEDLKQLKSEIKPQIEYAQECAKADVVLQALLSELKESKRKNRRQMYDLQQSIPPYSIETLTL